MDLGSIREHFRWRGPWTVFLLALREFFKPLVYWHVWNIYETDLNQKLPKPNCEANCDVVFYTSRVEQTKIKPLLLAMGELAEAEIDTRFERGDIVGLASYGGKPIGYMWLGFSSDIELKYDTYWIIRQGEALRHGSFVVPAARGQGVHSLLNAALNSYAIQHGITRTLGSVSALNPQSLSLPRRHRKAISMTVFLARFRFPSFTVRKSFRAPLSRRFWWPGGLSSPAESGGKSRASEYGSAGLQE